MGKQLPFVPGIDLSGTVLAAGSAVTRIQPGDRVIAFSSTGAYAERAVAPETLSFHLPPELNLEPAAAFPLVAGTAMHMLKRVAGLRTGERVLIHAASGGVGSAAIQVARTLGASAVAATTGRPWQKNYLTKIGADIVFDLRDGVYQQSPNQRSRQEGFDIILNPFGGTLVAQDLEYLNDFGRLALYGSMSGPMSAIPPDDLFSRSRQIIGFSFGHFHKIRPEAVASTIEEVIEAIAGKQITIPVHNYYQLKDAAEVHKFLQEKKITGKTVLLVR